MKHYILSVIVFLLNYMNILLQTTLDNISESIVEYLGHKTPQVKGEVASFLARCFTRCTPAILTKKLLKLFVTPLLKVILFRPT